MTKSRVSTLIVTRGLPASGKTTRAMAWVAEDPTTRCRVNRDDLRLMFHGKRWTGIGACETAVTTAQFQLVDSLLTAGFDVISDDTWLHEKHFASIATLARDRGCDFLVYDMRDVHVDTCVERDKARGSLVGEKIIRDMHARYIVKSG